MDQNDLGWRKIGRSMGGRARRFKIFSTRVLIWAVIGGSAVAALATLASEGEWPPSPWFFVVLLAIVLSSAGSIFLALTDDASDHLEDAIEHLALRDETAKALDEMREYAGAYRNATSALRSLFMIHANARPVLERALTDGAIGEETLSERLLTAIRPDLRIALGLAMDHHWTIVVYKAELNPADGYYYLRCVAHDRAFPCEKDDARRWREGQGVAGLALAKGDEVVAPDITHPSAISLFSLNNGVMTKDDFARYRSMIGVPIRVGNDPKPWGVALASSNQEDHFRTDEERVLASVDTGEGVRTLAGLMAVAVAISRAGEKAEQQQINGGKGK